MRSQQFAPDGFAGQLDWHSKSFVHVGTQRPASRPESRPASIIGVGGPVSGRGVIVIPESSSP
jgi:hypothetical protein